MNNTMEYRGYVGSVEFSEADQLLFGKVQGIRSLISYEGTTVSELIEDFHGAVDDYLTFCNAEGKTPEKAFKGSFNIRFKNTDLHKRAAIYAYNHNVSLNSVVEESVAEYLSTRQDSCLSGLFMASSIFALLTIYTSHYKTGINGTG